MVTLTVSLPPRRSLRPILNTSPPTPWPSPNGRLCLVFPFLLPSPPRRPRDRTILPVARRHLRTCRTPSRLPPLQSPSPSKALTTCRQTVTRNLSLPQSAYREICLVQSRTTSSTMILSLPSPSQKTPPILPRLPHGQHPIMATNLYVSSFCTLPYLVSCTSERPHNVEGLERMLCTRSRPSLCPLVQVVPFSVTALCAPTLLHNILAQWKMSSLR